MKKRLFIQPAPGRLVRHHRTMRHLPADKPSSVPAMTYYYRRIACGDAIEVDPPKPKLKTKTTKG